MRKLLIFTLPFAAGTLLCQFVLHGKWRILVAAAAILTAVLFAARLHGRAKRIVRIGTAGLAAGVIWYTGYAAVFFAPMEALAGGEAEVRVELLDYAEETDSGARCKVKVVSPALHGKAMYYGDRVPLLYLEPGDRIRAKIKYYSAATLSGEESAYFTSQGIYIRLYASAEQAITGGHAGGFRYLPQRLAKRLQDTAAGLYPADTGGFLTAFLTGERDGLDLRTSGNLSKAGLMHITAVSGLHCGFLITALGYLLLRRQKLTALLGYPVLLLYMVMVGCTPSVIRSCIMVGFALLAPLLNRESDGLTSLSGALLVILAADPFAAASVSLQLSFAAATGILLLSPRVYAALQEYRPRFAWVPRRVWGLCSGVVSSSLSVMVLTAPLNALYFGELSLISPIANLLVLWMVSWLFSTALIVTVLCSVWTCFVPLAAVPEYMARYVLWVAGMLAKVPGHSVRFTGPAVTLWLLLVYAMLILCMLSKDRRRKYIIAGIAAAVCLIAARALPVLSVGDSKLTAVAVNVGQGAATLLHSGDCTVLVDCGSLGGTLGAGKAVLTAMETYGWHSLDQVALTHYHEDHANGLEELFTQIKPGELLVPQLADSSDQSALQRETLELAEQYGIPIKYVEIARETVDMGEAVLTIFPPVSEGRANEEGLTVLCTAGEFDLLITGDMASATEQELIDTYLLPDIEVLIAGHHGSKYSNSKAFLEAVAPEVGVISAGAGNRFGHPAQETLGRMESAGMAVFRTDLHGNILIRVHRS